MDIVTHAMMGAVAASPFIETRPLAATAFVLGSVLPDADVLARLGGKCVFLRHHQTATHSLVAVAMVGVGGWLLLRPLGIDAASVGVALACGMVGHSLLDLVATYGVTLFWPLSRRRVCLEWTFFVDLGAIALTIGALGAIVARAVAGTSIGPWPAVSWGVVLANYGVAKVTLRRRALRLGPTRAASLLPSMAVPWTFLGVAEEGGAVRTWRVNALTGRVEGERRNENLGGGFEDLLASVPEAVAMRSLSAFHRVVERREEPGGTRLVLRDLRTRNLRTRFGELSLLVGPDGAVREKRFHV